MGLCSRLSHAGWAQQKQLHFRAKNLTQTKEE